MFSWSWQDYVVLVLEFKIFQVWFPCCWLNILFRHCFDLHQGFFNHVVLQTCKHNTHMNLVQHQVLFVALKATVSTFQKKFFLFWNHCLCSYLISNHNLSLKTPPSSHIIPESKLWVSYDASLKMSNLTKYHLFNLCYATPEHWFEIDWTLNWLLRMILVEKTWLTTLRTRQY